MQTHRWCKWATDSEEQRHEGNICCWAPKPAFFTPCPAVHKQVWEPSLHPFQGYPCLASPPLREGVDSILQRLGFMEKSHVLEERRSPPHPDYLPHQGCPSAAVLWAWDHSWQCPQDPDDRLHDMGGAQIMASTIKLTGAQVQAVLCEPSEPCCLSFFTGKNPWLKLQLLGGVKKIVRNNVCKHMKCLA